MRPWPRQVGHQPRGELNENCLGSSSGKDSPLAISVRVVENQPRTSPEASAIKHEPLPSFSAFSRAALIGLAWEAPSFAEAPEDVEVEIAFKSAITTSTSCSL